MKIYQLSNSKHLESNFDSYLTKVGKLGLEIIFLKEFDAIIIFPFVRILEKLIFRILQKCTIQRHFQKQVTFVN